MSTNYKDSKHKWTYIWLGLKYWVSPQKIYDLAHGNVKCHRIDKPIMHDLKIKNIIRHLPEPEGGYDD
ncbi:MAG: hypothetical protein MJZ36_06130 [Bacteroidaceae bacterium]|nr:hypothetical protein [Bacteroidaceae bacterium]